METPVSDTLIEEEYKIWRKNVPHIYDLMYTQPLKYQSPSVQWFPTAERVENRSTVQKLLMTTFTAQTDREHLLVAEASFPDMVDEDSLTNANISFRCTQSIPLPCDLNRARYSPLAPNIIGCRASGPDVLVYDYTKHSSANSGLGPDVVLSGHRAGGFALDWSPINFGQLATGGEDNLVCLFDINKGLVSSFETHTNVVNDLSFSHFNPHQFCSVSDDKRLVIHDTREGKTATVVEAAHQKFVEACSFSPFKAELLVTGSRDNTLKIWDTRALSAPVYLLRGHRDAITAIKWSPHYESILASASQDRRVIVWDLNRAGTVSANESEELLFIHGGHTDVVDDLDWNYAEPMEIASVSTDKFLHIWKIPLEEYI
ncbi:histone-binding protein RBBP4 [Pancytospora philotis]|nr:histone-binding protein RBBP4 [Pancytospora philotis]